jgi:hypothetical protein
MDSQEMIIESRAEKQLREREKGGNSDTYWEESVATCAQRKGDT